MRRRALLLAAALVLAPGPGCVLLALPAVPFILAREERERVPRCAGCGHAHHEGRCEACGCERKAGDAPRSGAR